MTETNVQEVKIEPSVETILDVATVKDDNADDSVSSDAAKDTVPDDKHDAAVVLTPGIAVLDGVNNEVTILPSAETVIDATPLDNIEDATSVLQSIDKGTEGMPLDDTLNEVTISPALENATDISLDADDETMISPAVSDTEPEVDDEVATFSHSDDTISNKIEIDFQIRFDGGSRGNPGTGGAGAELQCAWSVTAGEGDTTTSCEKKMHIRTYLGTKITNNQAEYQGAISGLQEVLKIVEECNNQYQIENPSGCHVTMLVQGDSKLVINQLRGDYQCKSNNLKPLYAKAKTMVSDLGQLATLDVTFEHIYRRFNSIADGEYQDYLDGRKRPSLTLMILLSSILSHI
jgi:ribonuclease HI